MSYNGSGVYTLPGAALANGDIVSATENNTFRNDVASALNIAWTRDGQAPATANIPMGSHKLTGLAAGTGNGDSVRYEQFASPPAIGSTTPAAGSFTTLSATGNVTLGDASTDTLNVGNGGIVKDSSGNVGIGTGSPDALLTVNTIASFGDGAVTTPSIAHKGDLNTGFWFPAADTVAASTGGTERMRIDSSGNVGIGVTPVATSLGTSVQLGNQMTLTSYNGNSCYFDNNIYYNGGFKYTGNGYGFSMRMTDANLTFSNAPNNTSGAGAAATVTERMRIDSSGNVGIGTSSPSYKLHVVGTDATQQIRAQNTGNTAGLGLSADAAGNALYWGGSDVIRFINASTERMRIDSSGNLLVGTTSLTAGSGRITAKADGGGNAAISANSPGTGAYNVISIENGNGQVGRIQTNASATSYLTSSDYRLKENIQPMQNALATVAQLNPVTYTWKVDGKEGQGFIAHELQAVVPDCVGGEKDAVDAEGNPVYQGIDTSFLVATLTKAIQELKAELDATKAEVAALKQGA